MSMGMIWKETSKPPNRRILFKDNTYGLFTRKEGNLGDIIVMTGLDEVAYHKEGKGEWEDCTHQVRVRSANDNWYPFSEDGTLPGYDWQMGSKLTKTGKPIHWTKFPETKRVGWRQGPMLPQLKRSMK